MGFTRSVERSKQFLAAVIVSTVVLGLVPAAANAAFPGQNGRIAFGRVTPSPYTEDLYSMTAFGSDQVRLTSNAGVDASPAWSPNGQQIAFVTLRDDPSGDSGSEIYVMNANGSLPTRITNNTDNDASPAWSPDGSKLAFASDRSHPNGDFDIYVMNADGSNPTRITENSTGFEPTDCCPVWSPDGTKIAYAHCEGGNCDIHVMNPDGSGDVDLWPTTFDLESEPDWSPDGSKLVFSRDLDVGLDCECPEIWVMNADGTGRTKLTTSVRQSMDGGPVWSPDGTRIAYWSNRLTGHGAIYVMTAVGGVQTPITSGTDNEGWDGSPDWQPATGPPPINPSYDHPANASPLHFEFVPEFRQTISSSQCTARGGVNSSHGPPLAFASCAPPAQLPGTQARIGPQSTSGADFNVVPGDTEPTNGDQADVTLIVSLSDVQAVAGGDYNPSTGADLVMRERWRLSDSHNNTTGQPCNSTTSCVGTVIDFEFPHDIQCTPTVSPLTGSACSLTTTLDATIPDVVKENRATVIQLHRIRINDAGPNGTISDSDDKRLASQGIYIP